MNAMSGHPIREEEFDLYALGALDADEKRAVESHLASCAECAGKLAEAHGRLSLLAFSSAESEPSPQVKERILAQVRAEAAAHPARSAAATRDASASGARAGGSYSRWWAAILIPATAALAISTAILWNQKVALNQELADLRSTLAGQQAQIEEAQELKQLFESKETMTVALTPQRGTPPNSAHVMYNSHLGMLLYDGTLTPAPPDKSYQLWLVPQSGAPINAGVFQPIAGHPDHWMMKLPKGVAPKAFAITLEPAGGMPQPTGPMVLVGGI
jgi:anti-sigma-K factor RskA